MQKSLQNSSFEVKYHFRIDTYHTSAVLKSIPYQSSFIILKFQQKPDEIRFYLLYILLNCLGKLEKGGNL